MGKYLNDYEGTRTPPGWDRVMMRERNVGAYFSVDGEAVDYGDMHFDDALRAQVAPDREASTDAPIFAFVSPRAPHRHPQKCERGQQGLQKGCTYMPLVMDQDKGAEACADIPAFKPPNYGTEDNGRPVPWSMPDFPDGWPLDSICESLLVVDRMVGEIVDAQAARGRPAYFVFLSDNGMAWGQKSFPQKHVPPATRLPFYLAGPGIEPGETDAFLSNVDLGATLAALGGATLEGDGISSCHSTRPRTTTPHANPRAHAGDPDGFYDGWAANPHPGAALHPLGLGRARAVRRGGGRVGAREPRGLPPGGCGPPGRSARRGARGVEGLILRLARPTPAPGRRGGGVARSPRRPRR